MGNSPTKVVRPVSLVKGYAESPTDERPHAVAAFFDATQGATSGIILVGETRLENFAAQTGILSHIHKNVNITKQPPTIAFGFRLPTFNNPFARTEGNPFVIQCATINLASSVGACVIACCSDGYVRLYDAVYLHDLFKISTHDPNSRLPPKAFTSCFCPLNNALVVGFEDGSIQAYYLETKSLASSVPAPSPPCSATAFSFLDPRTRLVIAHSSVPRSGALPLALRSVDIEKGTVECSFVGACGDVRAANAWMLPITPGLPSLRAMIAVGAFGISVWLEDDNKRRQNNISSITNTNNNQLGSSNNGNNLYEPLITIPHEDWIQKAGHELINTALVADQVGVGDASSCCAAAISAPPAVSATVESIVKGDAQKSNHPGLSRMLFIAFPSGGFASVHMKIILPSASDFRSCAFEGQLEAWDARSITSSRLVRVDCVPLKIFKSKSSPLLTQLQTRITNIWIENRTMTVVLSDGSAHAKLVPDVLGTHRVAARSMLQNKSGINPALLPWFDLSSWSLTRLRDMRRDTKEDAFTAMTPARGGASAAGLGFGGRGGLGGGGALYSLNDDGDAVSVSPSLMSQSVFSYRGIEGSFQQQQPENETLSSIGLPPLQPSDANSKGLNYSSIAAVASGWDLSLFSFSKPPAELVKEKQRELQQQQLHEERLKQLKQQQPVQRLEDFISQPPIAQRRETDIHSQRSSIESGQREDNTVDEEIILSPLQSPDRNEANEILSPLNERQRVGARKSTGVTEMCTHDENHGEETVKNDSSDLVGEGGDIENDLHTLKSVSTIEEVEVTDEEAFDDMDAIPECEDEDVFGNLFGVEEEEKNKRYDQQVMKKKKKVTRRVRVHRKVSKNSFMIQLELSESNNQIPPPNDDKNDVSVLPHSLAVDTCNNVTKQDVVAAGFINNPLFENPLANNGESLYFSKGDESFEQVNDVLDQGEELFFQRSKVTNAVFNNVGIKENKPNGFVCSQDAVSDDVLLLQNNFNNDTNNDFATNANIPLFSSNIVAIEQEHNEEDMTKNKENLVSIEKTKKQEIASPSESAVEPIIYEEGEGKGSIDSISYIPEDKEEADANHSAADYEANQLQENCKVDIEEKQINETSEDCNKIQNEYEIDNVPLTENILGFEKKQIDFLASDKEQVLNSSLSLDQNHVEESSNFFPSEVIDAPIKYQQKNLTTDDASPFAPEADIMISLNFNITTSKNNLPVRDLLSFDVDETSNNKNVSYPITEVEVINFPIHNRQDDSSNYVSNVDNEHIITLIKTEDHMASPASLNIIPGIEESLIVVGLPPYDSPDGAESIFTDGSPLKLGFDKNIIINEVSFNEFETTETYVQIEENKSLHSTNIQNIEEIDNNRGGGREGEKKIESVIFIDNESVNSKEYEGNDRDEELINNNNQDKFIVVHNDVMAIISNGEAQSNKDTISNDQQIQSKQDIGETKFSKNKKLHDEGLLVYGSDSEEDLFAAFGHL